MNSQTFTLWTALALSVALPASGFGRESGSLQRAQWAGANRPDAPRGPNRLDAPRGTNGSRATGRTSAIPLRDARGRFLRATPDTRPVRGHFGFTAHRPGSSIGGPRTAGVTFRAATAARDGYLRIRLDRYTQLTAGGGSRPVAASVRDAYGRTVPIEGRLHVGMFRVGASDYPAEYTFRIPAGVRVSRDTLVEAVTRIAGTTSVSAAGR